MYLRPAAISRVDGGGKILLLFRQNVELLPAAAAVLLRSVLPLRLYPHVVNLQREYCQTVYCPRRAFGVYRGAGQGLHVLELCQEMAVYALHEVGARLVAAVYPALYLERGGGVDFRVAYDVLQMPLHGVDPLLCVQLILNVALGIRVLHCGVHVVRLMVVCYRLTEYLSANIGECHAFKYFTFLLIAKVMFFR